MTERLKRLDRIFPRHPVYFVTLCAAKRQPRLANPRIHDVFRDFANRGEDFGAFVGPYVLMPDHIHLFIALDDERTNLSKWIKAMKGTLTKVLRDRAQGVDGRRPPLQAAGKSSAQWQKGFFDHILRSSESYTEKWNYVRENPVRAGLVASADDWPYAGEIHRLDVRDIPL